MTRVLYVHLKYSLVTLYLVVQYNHIDYSVLTLLTVGYGFQILSYFEKKISNRLIFKSVRLNMTMCMCMSVGKTI